MKKNVLLFSVVVGLFTVHSISAQQDTQASTSPAKDNEEVARLFTEDQSDRQPKEGKEIDWKTVKPRDSSRHKRIMELYAAGELKTGRDYYQAGMILQHGDRPEDYLLCHELCVAAVFKAEQSERAAWIADAKWLAAASEDRFLLEIGRAQRFGTQFRQENRGSPWRLRKIEDGVSDELRKAWNVPSLTDAKKREVEMNKKKE